MKFLSSFRATLSTDTSEEANSIDHAIGGCVHHTKFSAMIAPISRCVLASDANPIRGTGEQAVDPLQQFSLIFISRLHGTILGAQRRVVPA